MGRLLVACVLVAIVAASASAAPGRKVKVDSTPAGATVYLDDIENGSVCDATPCTFDAPFGEHTVIVRLDKHAPEILTVDVTKGKKPLPLSFKLRAATGTIVIDSPKGASVRINDEDQGKVPISVDVPAETVRVVVTLNGKTLHDDFIEVETGGEVNVKVNGKGGSSAPPPDDSDDDVADAGDSGDSGDSDDSDDSTPSGGDVSASGDAKTKRQTIVQGGLAFDVGFRRFVFSDGSSPFNNNGEVLLGPAIEVWPGRMAGVKPLRGLSLFGRVQFGVSSQNVTRTVNGTMENVGANTLWGALEVSLRNKWKLSSIGLEISAGYVRDQVEFNVANSSVLTMVPSADYKSLRMGARISLVSKVEPYISAENRIVLDGGELANRADHADTSGYRVAAGVYTRLGPLGTRVEGSMGKYSWEFRNDTGTLAANAATDQIFYLSVVVGYEY